MEIIDVLIEIISDYLENVHIALWSIAMKPLFEVHQQAS